MGTMLHNIGLHIFSTTFDKLPSTVAATGVKNRQSTAELENPANTFLINLYDRPGIPLKSKWVPFSKLNPCPICCHKWTILMHLLVFSGTFLQVVQARRHLLWHVDSSRCLCCIGDSMANKGGFSCDVTHSKCTSCQCSMHALYEI